jgi:hypothetical protein
MVFENRVLGRIIGPKRDEMMEGCIVRGSVTCSFFMA